MTAVFLSTTGAKRLVFSGRASGCPLTTMWCLLTRYLHTIVERTQWHLAQIFIMWLAIVDPVYKGQGHSEPSGGIHVDGVASRLVRLDECNKNSGTI